MNDFLVLMFWSFVLALWAFAFKPYTLKGLDKLRNSNSGDCKNENRNCQQCRYCPKGK